MEKIEPLQKEEIDTFISSNPDWKYEDDRLKAAYSLTSFDTAIEVINAVAKVCGEMDHHPLLTNVYNKLMFSLCTHSAGDKVTSLDIELAKKINDIIASK